MQKAETTSVSPNSTNTVLYAGWISVVYKLPADGEVVLCFEDRKCNQFVTQFLNKEDGFQEEWYEKCACTIDGNNYDCKAGGCKGVFGRHPFVTHWVPLPPSPCV